MGRCREGGQGEFKAAGKGSQVKELGYGRGGYSGGTQHAEGHLPSVLTQPDSERDPRVQEQRSRLPKPGKWGMP